jgi:GAF domain-containing protein
VNSTLDLETVLDTIVAKAVQLSNTDAGAIYVHDERDGEFHLRATYGMDQELIDALSRARISVSERNVSEMLMQRQPIQVADLREEDRSPVDDIVLGAGYRARLGRAFVPRRRDRRHIGGAPPRARHVSAKQR